MVPDSQPIPLIYSFQHPFLIFSFFLFFFPFSFQLRPLWLDSNLLLCISFLYLGLQLRFLLSTLSNQFLTDSEFSLCSTIVGRFRRKKCSVEFGSCSVAELFPLTIDHSYPFFFHRKKKKSTCKRNLRGHQIGLLSFLFGYVESKVHSPKLGRFFPLKYLISTPADMVLKEAHNWFALEVESAD